MNILSIDTASNVCGVSILKDTNLICQLDEITGRTHSEKLMPFISNAFSVSNLTLQDIDLLICDIGPGSFTGIRIGIATIMAFHDSLNIPCVGVNSLECLAFNLKTANFDNSKNNYFVCPVIDCKNSNCYFALYEVSGNDCIEIISPKASSIDDLCKTIHEYSSNNPNFNNNDFYFIGDGSISYFDILKSEFIEAKFADKTLNQLNSYSLALAGIKKFENSNFSNNSILPLYLKKPQAQRQLEEKLNSKSVNIERCDFDHE